MNSKLLNESQVLITAPLIIKFFTFVYAIFGIIITFIVLNNNGKLLNNYNF